MKKYSTDIICVQETRIAKSMTFVEDGFLIVLSGSDSEERSWAGVGFIISPRCRRRVKAYQQVSDRLAYLKIRVAGGVAGLITLLEAVGRAIQLLRGPGKHL